MILPFSERKKAFWNLQANLGCIDDVLNEPDLEHFEQDLIHVVYPKLRKYGLLLPKLVPLPHGEHGGMSRRKWRWHYETYLKALRRQIRTSKFNFDTWNADVKRNDGTNVL